MLKRLILLFVSMIAVTLSAFAAQVGGNPQGRITLTEFFDYQCPHCRNMENTIDGLIKNNPDLRVVYRVLPILDNDSWVEAKAAIAAGYQNKFANFHQLLMYQDQSPSAQQVVSLAAQLDMNKNQLETDMTKNAVAEAIKDNFAQAKELQVAAVPTFFIGLTNATPAYRFDGEVSYAQLDSAITQLRNQSKTQ